MKNISLPQTYCTSKFVYVMVPSFAFVAPWCSGYSTTAQLHSTKPELRFCAGSNPARRVGDSRWWGSLTMVPAGNKAKRLSSVNHTTKTIHHHQTTFSWYLKSYLLFWLTSNVAVPIFTSRWSSWQNISSLAFLSLLKQLCMIIYQWKNHF